MKHKMGVRFGHQPLEMAFEFAEILVQTVGSVGPFFPIQF
jgi:hypothetical protein